MRLFIAIPFEPPVLDALCRSQSALQKAGVCGNYSPRQNLHMTLAFLGEVRDPRPVIDVLERVPVPQALLRYDKTELFRDIFVCSFSVGTSLTQYVARLRAELDASGVDFDRKPFRPHVTLIRRTSFTLQKPDRSLFEPYLQKLDIPVRRVCLMRTDFMNGRPKYTPLHTVQSEA